MASIFFGNRDFHNGPLRPSLKPSLFCPLPFIPKIVKNKDKSVPWDSSQLVPGFWPFKLPVGKPHPAPITPLSTTPHPNPSSLLWRLWRVLSLPPLQDGGVQIICLGKDVLVSCADFRNCQYQTTWWWYSQREGSCWEGKQVPCNRYGVPFSNDVFIDHHRSNRVAVQSEAIPFSAWNRCLHDIRWVLLRDDTMEVCFANFASLFWLHRLVNNHLNSQPVSIKCRVHIADCRLDIKCRQGIKCRLQTAFYTQSAVCNLHSAFYTDRIVNTFSSIVQILKLFDCLIYCTLG